MKSEIQFNFENKMVVVTGGAQGIGYQIALQFLQSGAMVSVWDFSESALQLAQRELSTFGDKVTFTRVDITDRNSCTQASLQLKKPLDVLVNNAGITRDKSFVKLTAEDWDAVISTNLTGLFNVTKALLDKFNTSTLHKRIVNISSVVGLYGNFGQSNYAAAKSGVIGLTKTWGKELGKKGFTVNAVAPGFIQTAMTKQMPKEVLDQMAQKVPVARLGETSDIANAVLFLSSEQASYINGTTLSVDGGIVL